MNKIIYSLVLYFFFTNFVYGNVKLKIIENLKKAENLSFKFKQTVSGKDEQGECIIKYPKKIYCQYNLRHNKILVSNGKSLVIKSDKNRQYYRYSLKNTPLNFLLDKNFLIQEIKKLNKKIINNKYINFSFQKNNYDINIFFNKEDYNLIGWQTEDIYQNLAVTYIYNLEVNKNINEKLFILPDMH